MLLALRLLFASCSLLLRGAMEIDYLLEALSMLDFGAWVVLGVLIAILVGLILSEVTR